VRLESPSGLAVVVNRNGSLRRLEHRDVVVNTFPGTEMEGGPANVFLRRHGTTVEHVPLLGPRSPGRVALDDAGLRVHGEWRGVRFTVVLVLAAKSPAWFWHVRLENAGREAVRVDLVHAQDVSLAPYGAIRMNEYYVSQYLDHVALVHAIRGTALAVRQNLAVGDRNPWALIGSLGRSVGWATDALQLHGLATRAGGAPAGLAGDLPGRRLQHEHAMAVIQDEAVELGPAAVAERGFFGWFEVHHPAPTVDADVAFVDRALALPEAVAPAWASAGGEPPAATLFSARPVLAGEPLDETELERLVPGERRHVERDGGELLSFFTGEHRHVVLPAKERQSLRPHGHIMRTGSRLVPEEASLTSTAWMDGVFHSLVTQGHVNINRVLSTVRSYLGLTVSGGLRIFVERADGWHRFGVPSVFEMTPPCCRWTYKLADGMVRIESTAATGRHELGLAIEVLSGPPRRFLLSRHVALGGDDGLDPVLPRVERDGDTLVLRTTPDTEMGRRFPDGSVRIEATAGTRIERVAGDEALFGDGVSRREPFVVTVTAPATALAFRMRGELVPDEPAPARTSGDAFWREVAGGVTVHAPKGGEAVLRLQDVSPWFAHDALIHYLAPRGLEQYSGGGWGTRDVCQGPVELLLALGRTGELRELLRIVFSNHNPDGDWPQWWMFFERDRGIRAPDAHGDIIFWPVLALAQYLLVSDDAAFLDVELPYFDFGGDDKAEHARVWAHVERALQATLQRQIPGTSLVAYGHGDWNDSLQPVDPVMRERLCSSWTVTLQYQTLTTLAAALRHVGRGALAAPLDALAERTLADFQRLLIVDGTLAGFAWFHEDGRVEPLLHPKDERTGIHYRLLPMIHAVINGLFTPEQASRHVGLMREHLLAADGARLFDRPPTYHGGTQRVFQRAETSTYFGREIGIMYVHAHLRYAESMARHGDAEAFWLALRQAVPIEIRDVVRHARLRQANCYSSSSDACVADRYEAQERYADVRSGNIPVEGGWRVYSSGAGIAFRLIHENLLGLRRGRSSVVIDPVLPRALDGLAIDADLGGGPLRIEYRVGTRGCGPVSLTLNGAPLAFERAVNPYRPGGAVVPTAALRGVLVVQLG
jgi:cellobiose phosphorylase